MAPWGLFAAGCGAEAEAVINLPEPTPAPRVAKDPASLGRGALVVAHGGQGAPASLSDGPAAAVERVWAELEAGATLRQAAVGGIHLLEDDPRFNAGIGANLRLDGTTIECDAAVMSWPGPEGRASFGAVAGLPDVRHPVDLAVVVAQGPHLLVAGEGARALADRVGAERVALDTPGARAKLRRGWERLLSPTPEARAWGHFDWRAQWNYQTPAPRDLQEVDAALARDASGDAAARAGAADPASSAETRDTVGVVARDGAGGYVAALSTGGTTLALRGRVGDVPQLGHGLFAGPNGAVAATGKGEAIVRERVASEVYALLARGVPPDEAIRRGIRGIDAAEGVGVIAVSDLGYGARATSQMAWAARSERGTVRADDLVRTDRW